jgi:hypothetical protein
MNGVVSSDTAADYSSGPGKSNLEETAAASVARQEQSGRSDNTNREKCEGVVDEVGISHESETQEHWFPTAHLFAVGKTDEAYTAEEQTGDQVRSREGGHVRNEQLIPSQRPGDGGVTLSP